MVRISKEYDERLTEFLDTARQLFFEKGYEKTSVNDIIQKVGVAKGTFYHYFKSKEDLLDQLVNQFTEKSVSQVGKMMEQTDMNALEKANHFFVSIRNRKVENKDLMKMLMKFMYKDENLILRHKIFKRSIALLTPPFAEIIKQGIEEGHFHPQYPRETAEIIFIMAFSMNEIVVELLLQAEEKPENIDLIEQKIKVFEKSVERILGAPEGSFRMVERKYIEIFKLDSQGQDQENQSQRGPK
ncbi:MAG: TetR/AcrR family transcriptional regulator [Candidatus Aminicenantes bacterium]|nr:MAG: TetR/AcrR family transcriptional regulator [Candidatus Aminicenantes bacterium]